MRGKKVKQNLIDPEGEHIDEDFKSKRPYSEQYKENFEEFEKNWEGKNAAEFFRTIDENKFGNIKRSFANIADIKNCNFVIIDEDLPDVQKRFNLEKETVKITKQKKHSYRMIIFFALGITTYFFVSVSYTYRQKNLVSQFEELENKELLAKKTFKDKSTFNKFITMDIEERNKFIKMKEKEFNKNKFEHFEAVSLD